jgi:hypothetical protein
VGLGKAVEEYGEMAASQPKTLLRDWFTYENSWVTPHEEPYVVSTHKAINASMGAALILAMSMDVPYLRRLIVLHEPSREIVASRGSACNLFSVMCHVLTTRAEELIVINTEHPLYNPVNQYHAFIAAFESGILPRRD